MTIYYYSFRKLNGTYFTALQRVRLIWREIGRKGVQKGSSRKGNGEGERMKGKGKIVEMGRDGKDGIDRS